MSKLLDVRTLLAGGTVEDVTREGEDTTVLTFGNGTELCFDGPFDIFLPDEDTPAAARLGRLEDWSA